MTPAGVAVFKTLRIPLNKWAVPSADFIRFNQQTTPGRDAVALRITDPTYAQYRLPAGRFGQAAVYSEHFHHLGILRKVLLRMAAWMNYVFPLH